MKAFMTGFGKFILPVQNRPNVRARMHVRAHARKGKHRTSIHLCMPENKLD